MSLVAALELAACGIRVFPCKQDKTPYTDHGFKDASCDKDIIAGWWAQWPGALIGVPTGAISGFDILDVDRRHQGAKDWYHANRSRLPKTRAHRTRSGGLHLLFRHHDLVTCTVSKLARGIDTRGSGGYIIHWPSAGYPVVLDAPLAPWPEWLLAEFQSKPRPSSDHSTARIPDNYFLAELVRMAAGAREGERNSLCFWCACRAGEMVASGLLSAAAAVAVIAEAATRSGLSRKEAERTARSGVKTGGGHV
jgi:Bifunctional DNA primase/polymerase, N-terminal